MDWMDAMLANGQYNPTVDDEMVDDEDFYDGGSTSNAGPSSLAPHGALPGAPQDGTASNGQDVVAAQFLNATPNTTPGRAPALTPTLTAQAAEQRKLENQKKAEQLRAKLIANRQNTPNRANTPNKFTPRPEPAPQENALKKKLEDTTTQNGDMVEKQSEPSSDRFGIEALLQEGKAAAEAKAEAEDRAKVDPSSKGTQPEQAAESIFAAQQPSNTKPQITQPSEQQQQRLTGLETEYYADLSIWLEVTGYHDIEYRNSKLRTYKERKALEEEAARIQEKLEKLRQTEQAEMNALRTGSVAPTPTPSLAPPPLPPSVPTTDAAKPVVNKVVGNGAKRAHSPEPMLAEKIPRNREDTTGVRIRGANGANDSPQNRPANSNRAAAGSPIDRRIAYPEARRQSSFGEARGRLSRDPSLERRQAYYNRDGDGARGRERFEPSYPPPRENGGRGRMGFSAVNVSQERLHRDPYMSPPRGIRDVDTVRGANVRYLMIKSWNLDNVTTAMRDSLWSTQEKNEHLLADAYRSSRAVVLCFSVNNSKAFQGYALMTSPPDPSLPKPAFCAKLNWPTSPAFTLNWLATTPVHFRYVGHIKNEMNLDDEGLPSAVLVGKDGQEIAPEAGRALCDILDEVHAVGEPGGAFVGKQGGGGKGRAW